MLKPIGVQLYSLRDAAQKDFIAVLKRVADIGYKAVEPAGFWNIRPSEFVKIIRDLGLEMYSSHSPWARINNVGEVMEIADIIGQKKIVCGYGPADFADMDAIRRTAEATTQIYDVVSRNGFTLFQHNHAFEFERIDGRLKYEIYNDLVPQGLKYEIDCFWSTNFGAEDPVRNVQMFGDRTILLHMKDGTLKQKKAEQRMVNGILDRKIDLLPLGTGELPIKAIVEAAPAAVEAIIVELDFCSVEMDKAIEMSYRYMTENGLALGNK